jgi:hypothetical protein
MLRYVLNEILERSRLSRGEFEERFGPSFDGDFRRACRRLTALGAVKRRGGELRFSKSSRTRLTHAFFFAGPARVREWLERRHSSKNEIVVTLKGFRFCAWIEKANEERAYAARRGPHGLQLRFAGKGRAPAAAEKAVARLLSGVFARLEESEENLSGPERTYLLHRELAAFLRRSKTLSGQFALGPWISSRHNTGLGL